VSRRRLEFDSPRGVRLAVAMRACPLLTPAIEITASASHAAGGVRDEEPGRAPIHAARVTGARRAPVRIGPIAHRGSAALR
jgi:hypothetical protein